MRPNKNRHCQIPVFTRLKQQEPALWKTHLLSNHRQSPFEAARRGASDIHFEPFPDRTRVRFRIDGILEGAGDSSRGYHEALITRLKVLGGMDVAEKRLPQDGRFSTIIDGKRYDLRLSTLPTVFGEKMVVRLLEQTVENLSFDRLGISPEVMSNFKRPLLCPME